MIGQWLGEIATGREKLPISKVGRADERLFAIVFSRIREMLEQLAGRNWGIICAPTSRHRSRCRASQMPNRPNPKRLFRELEANCGSGGRAPMAQFMNGITGTARSKNTTVMENIRASFVPMAPQ
jgi:hypothetical protein